MVRIANLLIALTLLSIFSYLVIFVSFSVGGNGGEYWGFDGQIEPHIAAAEAYDDGRYEFLALEMKQEMGGLARLSPRPLRCENRDGPIVTTVKHNQNGAIHASDSVRFATEFAKTYNSRMNGLIATTFGIRCEKRID